MLPLMLGIALGLGHYYSDIICRYLKDYKQRLLSIASGITLAYVFLILLSKLYDGVQSTNKLIFTYVLIGFVMFYLLEKHIYNNAARNRRLKEMREAHSFALFVYHIVVGVLIVSIVRQGYYSTFLFFVPIFLHTTISMSSISELHGSVTRNRILKMLLSSSTLIGVLISMLWTVPAEIVHISIAFVSGALIYIVIREEIPSQKKGGSSFLFIASLAAYTILIIIDWGII